MESSNKIETPGGKVEKEAQNQHIKYTFSGIAPNLIDKFLVLGYDPKTIDYTYINCSISQSPDLNTRFNFYEFDNRPSIVNEICNDYSKDLLENDLVLELIFPNFPQMYFLDKQYINTEKEIDEDILISTYSIIFSINPQDNSGSKKSYNGLGFVFYVIQEHRIQGEIDGYLYVPNAYVILSEYPYFYHFNEICKNIFIQMKKENDEIPIDILIYNLVRFAPSPINKSINLYFGAPIGFHQNKTKMENILTSLKSNSPKDNNGVPSMFFNQLSGYPFMDVNISFLLNLIPPEIIVEVFIFSFLENDIIFYSFRPEILNMVMYIFSNLNYPFNDSIYYWHVLSVSQNSFMTGKSTFVGKTSSTLTGILSKYDPELLTTKKIREHFVLDIDNKNFFYIYQEETKEVIDVMTLFNYIKMCVEDVTENTNDIKKIDKAYNKAYFQDGFQLYEVIRNLLAELVRRSKKVTCTNYNEKRIKPTFLTMYEDESEMDCMEINMRLQKAFFTFITQVVKNCLGTFSKGEEDKNKDSDSCPTSRDPSFVCNIKKEENGYQEEGEEGEVEVQRKELAKKAGKIFREKFIDSSKYNSFIINFCQYHETVDLYEIPYSFINEFIYYSQIASKNNLSEVGVFQLIDQFYGKLKMLDFDEIINQKEKDKEIEKSKKDDKKDKKEKEKEKKEKEKKEKKKEKKNEKKNENKNEQKDEKDNNNDNITISDLKEEDTELENIYLFSFDNFTEFYQQNLRLIINREQEDDRDIFIRVKSSNRNYKKYKRNGYFLSNKILNNYMTYVNNNFDEIVEKFRLIKCEYANPKQGSELKKIEETPKETKSSTQIDYFYLLKNRHMDKSLWNLKFFGPYDFMEITDVIEHHFILERCFSSYGIIKFCLLNVLAVTRTIESQIINNQYVIEVIVDFCKKTKSLVRKYMNIYLNIFHSLQRNMNENQKEQFEINDCINLIISYIKKTNVIPRKEISEIPSENQTESSSNKSSLSKNSQSDDERREYIKKYGKFFEIKEGMFHRNTTAKFNEILKAIESIFTGKYNSFILSIDYKEVSELYNILKDKKGKFCPRTPVSLYVSTNKILRSYLNKDCLDSKYYDELCIDILSLLYYLKIPTIGAKWIDSNKEKEKEKKENLVKSFIKEKGLKKKEIKEENEEESEEVKNINKSVRKLIAILIDLFNNIINKRKLLK